MREPLRCIGFFGRGFVKLFQDRLRVPDTRYVYIHIFTDARRVNVYVDDLCVNGKLVKLAGYPVVKPRAHRDEEVRILDSVIGVNRAVHAEHAEREFMRIRKSAHRKKRRGYGYLHVVGQFSELPARAGNYYAAADIQNGLFAFLYRFCYFLYLPFMPLRGGVIAPYRRLFGIIKLAFRDLNVYGQIDNNRPGTPRAGNVKGLLHDRGKLIYILHKKIVLRDGARYARYVRLLESVVPDQVCLDLPGKRHHRNGIHMRSRDARNKVCRARPGRSHAHAHLARRAGVTVRRVRRALLVPRQDETQIFCVVKLVEKRQDRPARIPEKHLYLFAPKRLQNYFRAGHFHS